VKSVVSLHTLSVSKLILTNPVYPYSEMKVVTIRTISVDTSWRHLV